MTSPPKSNSFLSNVLTCAPSTAHGWDSSQPSLFGSPSHPFCPRSRPHWVSLSRTFGRPTSVLSLVPSSCVLSMVPCVINMVPVFSWVSFCALVRFLVHALVLSIALRRSRSLGSSLDLAAAPSSAVNSGRPVCLPRRSLELPTHSWAAGVTSEVVSLSLSWERYSSLFSSLACPPKRRGGPYALSLPVLVFSLEQLLRGSRMMHPKETTLT
mmetsp:Transcript_26588/g.57140  ORF Transcript_26588/g.57140 Transcript_26588/m.57140 type:complete len:212 (-) Transcript_26588:698-1333(-)